MSKKAAQKRAVEKRTQSRLAAELAARKEAAQRAAETKRRKREQAAQGAPKPEVAAQATREVSEAAKPKVAQEKGTSDRGPMVTVALRGEPAARLRALAASRKLSLAKLLVAMMEAFEAQAS